MKYTIKQYPDKSFTDKMDLIRFMQAKKDELFAIKKATYKTKSTNLLNSELFEKEFTPKIDDISSDFIKVKSIINTTNVIDSHMDLHLKNIWNKTVKDNPTTYHLQSHKADFEYVISNKAKQYNEQMNFKDLGLKSDMSMTANINEFVLQRNKMPLMFDAYLNGEVKEHSVGMYYIDLDIAFYDEESQKEMDYFNSVIKQAINPEVAIENGYVWVVSQAAKREGSAVVFGSNSITPTLSVENYEPSKNTRKDEPIEEITHKTIDYNYLKQNFNLKLN
jgi:hypothetical protein